LFWAHKALNKTVKNKKITVSGIVRVEDINTDNTVSSSALGDAKIKIDGNGPLASKQRQGIISQLFNFLF
jgi:flagellar L-ring protein precursor FlgH